MFTAGALGLAAMLSMPLTIATLTGEEIALPGAETARTFLAMMNDRSPGERTAAELTKTKTAVAVPRQRALGKVREPELPKTFTDAIAPPPPVLEPGPLFAQSTPVVPLATPPGGGVFIAPPGPPGGGGGGGGGGGTPETPENPPEQPPNNPPVPAVPEPGTWAMMLLGFAMSGWMIRRRRPAAPPLQVA